MARPAASSNIDDIITSAVSAAMEHVGPRIAKAIADAAASQVDLELARRLPKAKLGRKPARRQRRKEITRWVADVRARRVPNFVIEATGGLNTKRKIVTKYGENAVFDRSKPLPPERGALSSMRKEAGRIVSAKRPVVRKVAAK